MLATIDQVTASSARPGRHTGAEDRVTAAVRLLVAEIEHTRRAGIARYGARTEREKVTEAAAVLTGRLRPVDRAVRLTDHEFLLVVPGVTEDQAADLVRQVTADLERLGDTYPFVAMTAVSAITVTRRRPLPLDELRSTVDWAAAERIPIALLPS